MQKLFKNKKGDVGGSNQLQMFLLAELVIGGILLAGGIYLVIDLSGSSQTEVITRDLSLLIESISHKSDELSYNYVMPDFVTYVSISKDTVTIHSDKGLSSKSISPNRNIQITSKNFANPDMIPIFFSYKDKTLNFDAGDRIDGCTTLRLIDEGTQFKIETQGTRQEKEILDKLKNYIELTSPASNLFTEERNNIIIELSFNENNNFTIQSIETFSALNCYLETMFYEREDNLFEELEITFNQDNKIIIKIGEYSKIESLTNAQVESTLMIYATEIFNSLRGGIAT